MSTSYNYSISGDFPNQLVDNDRLFIDQTCTETLAALDQYQWDPNPNLLKEKPKHNRASHMADALRYALYSFETSNSGF